jgi:2-oxoglutarate ferredoxin oxidoreductase subunit alpha
VEEYFTISTVDAQDKEQLFINGNEAIGLGAVIAGVKYYTAYPMSPSTGIMNYIAGKQDELGIVVEQAEDEIGAINMALGASYGGIRTMTGTSGGGLALMAETVGLAGITETPLVIAEVQRPGPATGLPTRTEQGDLQFAINISQGEFPLLVLGPRDQEDAFYQSFRAHNLADKYQIPVIILSDQFLADSAKNVDKFDLDQLEVNRHLISDQEAEDITQYDRYKLTKDGISPRAYPGQIPGEVVLVDSDEHNQHGNIIEDAETRIEMVEKRMRKIDKLIEEDLKEPKFKGDDEIDYLLVGWGSTYGPLKEAKKLLNKDGFKVGCLSFSDLYPLPQEKLNKWSERDVEITVIENNATGQFARLITGETGIEINSNILKYDGRSFSGDEIYQRFKEEVIK